MEGQKSKRTAILELNTQGKTVKEIIKALSVTKWTVYRTIQRFNETGETSDRPRSGRPRSVRTPLLKKSVREKIRYNPKRSVQKMAKECNISTRTMGRLVHDDLGLKSYKFRKAQLLSDVNKKRRVEKCKKLRERFKDGRHLDILFTDEKLFSVECSFNRQNDRVLCSTSKGISPVARVVKRTQKPASVMVWSGITATGRTPLVFIDQGVKVNTEKYIQDILEGALEPWATTHFQGRHWIFQQDSAPAHKSKATQAWLKAHFPEIISPMEWPASSPDLNPMDFSIWSILESKACVKPHRSLEALRASLVREWYRIPQEVLSAASDCFYKRLSSCIQAKGDIFEGLI